jgi:PPOX class probable F420-dependent enzyme
MSSEPILSAVERSFLASARRAILATIAPDGRPRLVPICFALDPDRPVLYTPIDEKPKRSTDLTDLTALARVRDLLADPRASVLVDRWDEDWARLAWLRCHGTASLMEPGDLAFDATEHALAVAALRGRYEPYADQRLEDRPMIRLSIERTIAWGALEPPYG